MKNIKKYKIRLDIIFYIIFLNMFDIKIFIAQNTKNDQKNMAELLIKHNIDTNLQDKCTGYVAKCAIQKSDEKFLTIIKMHLIKSFIASLIILAIVINYIILIIKRIKKFSDKEDNKKD